MLGMFPLLLRLLRLLRQATLRTLDLIVQLIALPFVMVGWALFPLYRIAMRFERFRRFRDHAVMLLNREPWWAEVWAAIGTLMWSVWSFTATVGLDARPAWNIATAIMDDSCWQVTGLTLGAFKLAVLMIDHRPLRRLSCFLGCWWWWFLLYTVTIGDRNAPSASLYLLLFVINLHSLIRLPAVPAVVIVNAPLAVPAGGGDHPQRA